MSNLMIDKRLDVFVVDVLLAIGQRLEPVEGILEGILAQIETEFLQLGAERITPRMLAHDE